MGPLTETMPKPMLPVADRPLVAHVADAAAEAGADEFVFIVGYRGDRIRSHFGSEHAGVPVRYAEQSDRLGTADALDTAADLLDDDFAVLNGDSLYRAEDLSRLFSAVPQVGAARVEDPSGYGVLATEDGIVTEVREKPDDPDSDLVNAGAYTFPEAAIGLLDVPESERGERELTDVLERIIDRDGLEPVTFEGWMDVGRPWELLEANERRLPGEVPRLPAPDGGHVVTAPRNGSIEGNEIYPPEIHPKATIRDDVVIEGNVSIGPGTVIEGPTLVRAGSSVGPNAFVRGASLIGENVHIGHGVEIKNSVVMSGSNVEHLSYVGDSVLGRGVNFGAGTNVSNLRHDGEPVSLTVKGSRVSTGRRKFGVVLGPGVRTGIQTGFSPGVTLSAETRTDPGEIVSRDR
jgi:bifunctional UDP-N-acetylglucosamine pyrophosphorylase/glucosamine-1-phosphate N-acetyltransferase